MKLSVVAPAGHASRKANVTSLNTGSPRPVSLSPIPSSCEHVLTGQISETPPGVPHLSDMTLRFELLGHRPERRILWKRQVRHQPTLQPIPTTTPTP